MGAETNKKFDRYSTVKTTIKEVVSGDYVQEDEQFSNYLLTKNGKKIFRVNITAAVLHKEIQGSITNILIDDGSEKITLRSFEESKAIRDLTVGDVVLVIGRIRVYNKEKYISPEIVKKIDPLWLKVRSLELKGNKEISLQKTDNYIEKDKVFEEKEIEEEIKEDTILPVQKLRKLISELDEGDGVPIEEVIEKSLLDDTENLIQKMLENGDIFQNSPGKIKVL